MHKCDYVLLALAALTLELAFTASPDSASTKPQWAPAEIHLSGVHRSTAMLPEEDFPPY
jgi:hypothetical protein